MATPSAATQSRGPQRSWWRRLFGASSQYPTHEQLLAMIADNDAKEATKKIITNPTPTTAHSTTTTPTTTESKSSSRINDQFLEWHRPINRCNGQQLNQLVRHIALASIPLIWTHLGPTGTSIYQTGYLWNGSTGNEHASWVRSSEHWYGGVKRGMLHPIIMTEGVASPQMIGPQLDVLVDDNSHGYVKMTWSKLLSHINSVEEAARHRLSSHNTYPLTSIKSLGYGGMIAMSVDFSASTQSCIWSPRCRFSHHKAPFDSFSSFAPPPSSSSSSPTMSPVVLPSCSIVEYLYNGVVSLRMGSSLMLYDITTFPRPTHITQCMYAHACPITGLIAAQKHGEPLLHVWKYERSVNASRLRLKNTLTVHSQSWTLCGWCGTSHVIIQSHDRHQILLLRVAYNDEDDHDDGHTDNTLIEIIPPTPVYPSVRYNHNTELGKRKPRSGIIDGIVANTMRVHIVPPHYPYHHHHDEEVGDSLSKDAAATSSTKSSRIHEISMNGNERFVTSSGHRFIGWKLSDLLNHRRFLDIDHRSVATPIPFESSSWMITSHPCDEHLTQVLSPHYLLAWTSYSMTMSIINMLNGDIVAQTILPYASHWKVDRPLVL
jgi:hypothetical protein